MFVKSCAIVVAACCILNAGTDVFAGERFVQDRFAIGFWVDPPLNEQANERYREIADAGFSLVIGFAAQTPELAEKQLRLCHKFDLDVLLPIVTTEISDLPDAPECWGYLVRDEPNAGDFPALREKVDAIRAARPGKLAYINLFPNYANEKQLGTATYDEHVARYIAEVQPDVLSMDHYPIFKPGVDGRDAYCANLEVMRTHSLKAGIPFWNFFNTMPYGPHTDPTEAQLRWQVYATLSYGGKGILYFCYYTPAGGEFPKGGAIIARDGRKTRHYEQARRINRAVGKLAPTLMQLTSTGVHRVKPGDDPAVVLTGTPLKNLGRADYDPEHDLLIGTFRHADSRRAVMITNYHFAYSAWPTVEFDAPPDTVRELDQSTGKERSVIDDSPDLDGLQVSLDAGEGRLFLLP